jgi:hypothetical protein
MTAADLLLTVLVLGVIVINVDIGVLASGPHSRWRAAR